jgi:hypothetical protein
MPAGLEEFQYAGEIRFPLGAKKAAMADEPPARFGFLRVGMHPLQTYTRARKNTQAGPEIVFRIS